MDEQLLKLYCKLVVPWREKAEHYEAIAESQSELIAKLSLKIQELTRGN